MNFVKNRNKKYIIHHFLILVLLLFSLNITACSNSNEVNNNVSKEKTATQKQKNNDINKEENNSKQKDLSANILKKSDIQFDKKELKKENSVSFNTPWEKSPDGNMYICVEGKGEEAQEEGIGKVCVKDSQNNIWSFDIISSKKQITPKDVEWLDNENILVVVGQAYGTISKGGNVYILNINNGDCYLFYDTKDEKREVISCEVQNQDSNKVNVKMIMNIYEDDNFTKCSNKNLSINNMNLDFNNTIDLLDEDGNVFDTIK